MQIEKSADIEFPVSLVWGALANAEEFSAWFNVRFDRPFIPGLTAQGTVTYPGYEGLRCDIHILKREEPSTFSFSWHPHATDTSKDYSQEAMTVVEFTLAPQAQGTRVCVVEKGFEKLPPERAKEAYDAHLPGWDLQLENVTKYLRERA